MENIIFQKIPTLRIKYFYLQTNQSYFFGSLAVFGWDGWFLHYNTGYQRYHRPSVPCSVLLSNNYVIIKPCSRNIKDSINLAYRENVNIEVPVRLSFQSLPSFLGKNKPTKCTYFPMRCCFIHPPLIFVTQSLISREHITLCISLLNQSLLTFCIT